MMISHLLSGGRVEEARLLPSSSSWLARISRLTHGSRPSSAAIWRVLRPIPVPCAPPSFRWVERSPGRPGVETSFAAPRNGRDDVKRNYARLIPKPTSFTGNLQDASVDICFKWKIIDWFARLATKASHPKNPGMFTSGARDPRAVSERNRHDCVRRLDQINF